MYQSIRSFLDINVIELFWMCENICFQRASEDCQEHDKAKVTPANLKNVLNEFNMEFLYAGIDIKGFTFDFLLII